ncbi:sensor histidine kinase [Micromonospora sp. URMC 107]|uniref:sensor histidine kinase n=1 Tax=Micromonospora sp. URMC 107 TaxID=3423418 RepID=UPI003F19AA44
MGVVTAVFASISLIGFLHVMFLPVGPLAIALSFTCIAVLMAMQMLWYGRDNGRLRTPLGYGVLATQAALVYLPILTFGQAWVGMPGFLAGSVLLVLRAVAAWVTFALIVASMAVAQWLFTHAPIDMLYTAISTVTTGLVVYGLSRLTALVVEVQESRAEIARMAVLRERLRFARDLHDLLGYSLSAISLKIELVHRLMEKSPQEASDQLLEILEISRVALSDARTVASGYRELSLEEECRSAVSVLSAADIQVRLDSDHLDLSVQVSTVLATVLREGVTNILRHTKAKRCDITIRQTQDDAWIEIVNDDQAVGPPRDPGSGRNGLRNLSARAQEIGGSLTVDRQPDLFRLCAKVPLRLERRGASRSQPAGLPGDPDGVDAVAGGEFVDDRGQIVADGAD